jgi:hypothetical protein
MPWTYEYRDKPRPCYRIQDGSDDGDVAECWDEDVAQAIVEVMNVRCRWHSTERTPCRVCHPVSSDWLDRAWIPNTPGREVTVLLDDGTTVRTSVQRGEDGLHFLLEVPITRVVGWRPVYPGESRP